MRYAQSSAESAELLRLSLPLISRHGEGYHPVSYAIWYEYVAGNNAPLRAELDPLVEEGARLTESQTYQVYQRCIIDSWGAQALRVNEGLSGLIEDFSVSTLQVDGKLGQFEQSLASFNGALNHPAAESALQLASLREEGQSLQVGISALQGELVSSRDQVEQLKARLRKLESDVLTDPLTGLFNRRGLDQAFLQFSTEGTHLTNDFSLVMIDIDHFKTINDTYGHLFGDQVIRGVATALRSHAGPRDLVARYGGEEFVLLLPGASADAARDSADQIRARIAGSVIRRRGSHDIATRVTVSAGVTTAGRDDTLETLLGRADTALYMAKTQGRNQVALLV